MGRSDQSYPPSRAATASSSTVHLRQHDADSKEASTLEQDQQQQQQEEEAAAPKVKKHWMDKGFNSALGPVNVRRFAKKSYIKWYILLLIICVLVGLMTIYHDQIIEWMEPIANDLKEMPGSWAIPVGILIVLSFPPLFGHEIVGVLCGVIWPLWTAFGIVSLGTLLGELANFFVFKYACTKRAQKYEREDVTYACMVKVIQEGGFWVILVARFSAIPGHLTTPVFSTCGVNFWVFTITAILTLPKQLQVVYLGTIFNQPEEEKSSTSRWVQNGVLAFSFLVTLGAAWWLYRKMAHWRPIVERERAEQQEARELRRDSLLSAPGSTTIIKDGGRPGDLEMGPGHSTERLTDHAEMPAGYGGYVDPYQDASGSYSSSSAAAGRRQQQHPYNMPAQSSSSVALHTPQAGPPLEEGMQQQSYYYPSDRRDSEGQDDLSAYTKRQTQAYTQVIATPPGSRRPSFQPPMPLPQQSNSGCSASPVLHSTQQLHPSFLYPSSQQPQQQQQPHLSPSHQPRSSADYYRPQSGYYGQAM